MTNEIVAMTDLAVLSGDDALTLPLLSAGARGVISVTANVAPKLMRDMVHAALDGDLGKASKIHQALFPLSKTLFIETNPIPVKTALEEMGLIHAEFRLPLCEMGAENRKKLKAVLQSSGLLEGAQARG